MESIRETKLIEDPAGDLTVGLYSLWFSFAFSSCSPSLVALSVYQHVARQEGHSQLRRGDPVRVPQLPLDITLTSHSQLGFGTWQAGPGQVGESVYQALKAGYRHLVCALA